MEEYVKDELADGEEKKRIQRTEFRAGKKLKSVKGAKNKKGSGLQSGKKPQHANAQAGRGPSTDGMSGSSSGIQAGRSKPAAACPLFYACKTWSFT